MLYLKEFSGLCLGDGTYDRIKHICCVCCACTIWLFFCLFDDRIIRVSTKDLETDYSKAMKRHIFAGVKTEEIRKRRMFVGLRAI